ncbi:hypothetical protein EDC94DRAFT_531203 [Helicostylum pulchrum]|nr:hypothetical protein EDC94DRAFT_531203 [Helicostylum pulchrum]
MDSLNTTTSNIDQQQQSVSELPPTHGWSRSTETVTDLWREYTVGVGGGCAMRDINRNYPNWFIPHSKSFHYRRMRIIKGLEKHARDTDTSIEKCVQLAEARRLEAKKSLDSLGKAVKNIHDLLA